MIWLLYIILWILVGLAALALILVLVPVHLRGRGSVQGFSADGVLEVSWGWGFAKFVSSRRAIGEARLLGLRIWRYRHKTDEEKEQDEKKNREKRRKKEEKRKKKKQKEKKKQKKKQKKASSPESMKALGVWLNRKHLIELIRRMLATLRIRLVIQGRLGTGDPADTAIIITVIRQLDARIKYIHLKVEPVYEQDLLNLAGAFSGRLWLLHIIFVFVAALFNRDIRRTLKALV